MSLKSFSHFGIILLIGLNISFNSFAKSNNSISDHFSLSLPTPLVEQWAQQLGEDIDNPEAPVMKPLVEFKKILEAGRDANAAADALLKVEFKPGVLDPIQAKSYSLRVAYFRYLLENGNVSSNFEFLQRVKSIWFKKYIEGTLTLVNSVIKDYSLITSSFLNQWRNNLIEVVDLTPTQRNQFHTLLGKSHGISLNDQFIANNGKQEYKINGFYFSGNEETRRRVLAVDFSLPPGETMITLSHEVVHAADPKLDEYRSQLQAIRPKVQNVFNKLFPSNETRANKITQSIIDQVFLELGYKELILKNSKITETSTIKNLNAANSDSNNKITEEDIFTLRDWSKLVIKLTVENEYKAYGYSIAAYSQFTVLNMANINAEKDRFLSSLKSSDKNLAEELADYINPFTRGNNKYSEIELTLSGLNLSDNEKLTLSRSINLLESIYTQELYSFTSNVKDYFHKLLPSEKIMSSNSSYTNTGVTTDLNSDWTAPGQLNSPLNPYSIITAKLSTYWIVRLKQNIHLIVDELSKIKTVLLSLRSGVIDFTNLSHEEMKYLGLIAPDAKIPTLCMTESNLYYQKPLNSEIHKYSQTFPIKGWNSSSFSLGSALNANETLELIIAMELYHGLSWLDSDFTNLKTQTMANKVMLEKLYNKTDGTNDLSNEKIQELMGEIREAFDYIGKNVKIDLNEISLLYDFVIAGQGISAERKWNSAVQVFNSKKADIASILELMGFPSSEFNEQDSKDRWLESELAFSNTVKEKIVNQCQQPGYGGIFGQTESFNIYGKNLKISYACNSGVPYLYRMPCDMDRSLRTLQQTDNGGIYIGLSRDGRPISLPAWKGKEEE